jgi:hypothetical protein
MAALTTSELFKYDWRVEIFLRKYEGNEDFTLVGGRKVKFVSDKDIIAAVKKQDKTTLNQLGLLDTKGNRYTFGKLEKTAEFGGKGAGAGTAKEDIELASLQKQIDILKKELASHSVPIKVGTTVYQVAGAASTPGTPKSDFHLLDNDGKEIVWISHKDGRYPKDFQQWGGMTEKGIEQDAEVQSFVKAVHEMFGSEIPRATTVARKIRKTPLKNKSVYGVKYGSRLGQQNVSILIQGPVKLEKKGRRYEFVSNHIHYNGDRITGGFEPVLMAMYKGDRNQFGVKGARFAIQPIESRKITEFI